MGLKESLKKILKKTNNELTMIEFTESKMGKTYLKHFLVINIVKSQISFQKIAEVAIT